MVSSVELAEKIFENILKIQKIRKTGQNRQKTVKNRLFLIQKTKLLENF